VKKTLHIEGMYCSQCAALINVFLFKLDGIKDVKISVGDRTAIVFADREIDELDLRTAVDKAGYKLVSIE
jgi:copper chaperone CopZ